MNPDDTVRIADMVTLHDIAERCHVSKSTVRQWRSRDFDEPFPAPNYLGPATSNGSNPWWNWDEVSAWLDAHPTLGNRT